jgi:hypothetical protein
MILIIGDHGAWGDVFLIEDKLCDASQPNSDCAPTLNHRALPLVLIKPFGSNGQMQISYAPVTLGDIPQTVFSQLGLKTNTPGISMFALKESDNRVRRYLFYNWDKEDIKLSYMPEMTEYTVSGFSWLEKSWHATGRKFKAPKKVVWQPAQVWEGVKRSVTEQ